MNDIFVVKKSMDFYPHLDAMFVQWRDGYGDRVELCLPYTVTLDRLTSLRHHHDQTPGFAPHWALADVLYLQLQVVHPLSCKKYFIYLSD